MTRTMISCDWGLSTLRLRLLSGTDEPRIEGERSSPRGIAGFVTRSPADFRSVLSEEISGLFADVARMPEPLPVCLSGMVTSTLGWKQLPYARLPFRLDGSGSVVEQDVLETGYGGHPLHFVSGVASSDDTMRGEECEIVGIFSTSQARNIGEHAVVLLPGTHSKSVEVIRQSITAFRTFLTGELFDVLCRHSVLRHSVGEAAAVEADEWFEAGLRKSVERGLLGSLFSVRARSLLQDVAGQFGRTYLSGLLIGDELWNICSSHPAPTPVLVAGATPLQKLYVRGLELLGAGDRTHAVPAAVSARAASLGHWRLFPH